MRFLNELTIKNLLSNKKRTIATILGIMLSTFLVVSVGVFFSSVKENYIKSTIESNGDYHAKISSITKEEMDAIKEKEFISDYKIFYSSSEVKNSWFSLYNSSEFLINYVDSNYLNSIRLETGRVPQNSNEILVNSSMRLNLDEGVEELKVGDTVVLEIGNAGDVDKSSFDYYNDYLKAKLEAFEVLEKREVTVVGIYSDDVYNNGDLTNEFYTFYENGDIRGNKMFIWYDDMYKTKDYSFDIRDEFGYCYTSMCDPITYNVDYLSLYEVDLAGKEESSYLVVMFSYFFIIVGVISIGCIFVIYNSFSIAVTEKKKQIGLLSSIGASRSYIKLSIFYEGIILGIIGVILGVLFGILGSKLLIVILNNLVADTSGEIIFALYKEYLVVPILLMFLVILVSISRPMLESSKITPIEAIRLNSDVKIERKSVKGNKIVEKLFGIEGDIAYKNIKRNKKKYNVVVISMFISIVIFLVFSAMVDYLFKGSFDYLYQFDYDYSLTISDKDMVNFEKIKSNLLNTGEVDEFLFMKRNCLASEVSNLEDSYSKEFNDYVNTLKNNSNYEGFDEDSLFDFSFFVVLSDADFNSYVKDNNLKGNVPVLYNRLFGNVLLNDKSIKYFKGEIFKDDLLYINFCKRESQGLSNCEKEFDNYQLSSASFLGHLIFNPMNSLVFIISESMYENIEQSKMIYENSNYIFMKLNGYKKIEAEVESMMKDNIITIDSYYENIKAELDDAREMIFAIKLVVYLFVIFVVLIGVTSLFNTINISVNLRRREFAVLKSLGMSDRMFNKMILFESVFLGLKALLYAIPISFLVVFLLKSLNNAVLGIDIWLIPWTSLLIAIFGVFIIVFITMKYTISKIDSSIIDVIREENI